MLTKNETTVENKHTPLSIVLAGFVNTKTKDSGHVGFSGFGNDQVWMCQQKYVTKCCAKICTIQIGMLG